MFRLQLSVHGKETYNVHPYNVLIHLFMMHQRAGLQLFHCSYNVVTMLLKCYGGAGWLIKLFCFLPHSSGAFSTSVSGSSVLLTGRSTDKAS